HPTTITFSLHDALPICHDRGPFGPDFGHDAVELLDEGLPGWEGVQRERVGCPGPATVESDHPGERREPAEEQLRHRVFPVAVEGDRKSTRLNSSHEWIS